MKSQLAIIRVARKKNEIQNAARREFDLQQRIENEKIQFKNDSNHFGDNFSSGCEVEKLIQSMQIIENSKKCYEETYETLIATIDEKKKLNNDLEIERAYLRNAEIKIKKTTHILDIIVKCEKLLLDQQEEDEISDITLSTFSAIGK